MNKYRIPTNFIFRGYFDISANTKQEAIRYVERHCELSLGGEIQSSLPEESVDWKFETISSKKIDEDAIMSLNAKFQLYKQYLYLAITHFLEDDEEFEEIQLGRKIIGEHIITLKDTITDKTISFVLTGSRGGDSVYTCIYNDFS